MKINWNTLDNLQIIRLNSPVKALWGKFAPMNLMEAKNPAYWTDKNDLRLAGMKKAGYDPVPVMPFWAVWIHINLSSPECGVNM